MQRSLEVSLELFLVLFLGLGLSIALLTPENFSAYALGKMKNIMSDQLIIQIVQ